MAKDKSTSSSKDKDKKEKKEKKRSEEDGVHKKSKDSKKEKKQKTEVLTSKVQNAVENGEIVPAEEEVKVETVEKPRLVGALVPFANPLADEKVSRKVFKGVKKAAASKTLKRGVKEVVKALRKSPNVTSAVQTTSTPPGVVILAADISPMDVISHIPVLCEDHNIPYIYVTSRAELGAAGMTKRPTSVVMIGRTKGGKAGGEGEGEDEWKETYDGLVKVVEKEGTRVKI